MPDGYMNAAAIPDAGNDTLRAPTTVQVRHKYATVLDDTQGWRYSEEWGKDFDRWLAEHTAAAVQAERERCHCNGLPYPDLSRLAEMTGYLEEHARETGDITPLDLWTEIRSSINRPIREHIRKVQQQIGAEVDDR